MIIDGILFKSQAIPNHDHHASIVNYKRETHKSIKPRSAQMFPIYLLNRDSIADFGKPVRYPLHDLA